MARQFDKLRKLKQTTSSTPGKTCSRIIDSRIDGGQWDAGVPQVKMSAASALCNAGGLPG